MRNSTTTRASIFKGLDVLGRREGGCVIKLMQDTCAELIFHSLEKITLPWLTANTNILRTDSLRQTQLQPTRVRPRTMYNSENISLHKSMRRTSFESKLSLLIRTKYLPQTVVWSGG